MSGSSFSPYVDSSESRVHFAVFVSCASPASIIISSSLFYTQSERGPRPSQPGQCKVLPCLSRMFLLRYLRRDRTFVNSFVGRASTNCSPALPRIKCLGFLGSPTQMIRNSLSQESLPDSCLHTCLICAQRGVNRMSSSDVSFLPANTSLLHRSSRFVLSASWLLNKQIAPNCTSSLPRVFAYAVRPSLLIWNRVSMHEAVSLLSC